MGLNNTKPSKEYLKYVEDLELVREEFSTDFSGEVRIFKKETSMDPDELILVTQQIFDDESSEQCKTKYRAIELRKVTRQSQVT
jgi:hypothetical protein